MKRFLRFLRNLLLILVGLVLLLLILGYTYFGITSSRNLAKVMDAAPVLTVDGASFRDLNKNGELDPYEDHRVPTEARVENLLGQMTLEEKAGQMFITMIATSEEGDLVERPTTFNPFSFFSPTNSEMVVNRHMTHFNVTFMSTPEAHVKWHNTMQKLAEGTRLGIPITIASDPRHAFTNNPAAAMISGAFSKWPEHLGLAATGDSALVARFGDIARQEYLAMGFRLALHPMADLATEPRWARVNGTFGEDADLSARMTYAYIKGFQGDTLGPQSVATMTKHFSGGGPQKDGEDAHFAHGKDQVYPGNNFDYHLIPFEKGAFPAHTAQIMPYYSIPVGQTSEEVGFAFNQEIITGMLRERYGFDGVICTDWSLLTDKGFLGFTLIGATGWGMENATPLERVKKALDAGIDQFGGEALPRLVVELVQSRQISEARIDQSVRRLLRDKFTLGLFDNPYVDAGRVHEIVGRADFMDAGLEAQRKSVVLLKNDTTATGPMLPLQGKPRLYIENIDPEVAGRYGTVVDSVADADVAILRLSTPYQPRDGFFEGFFHQGDLDFKEPERTRILNIINTIPTIVDIYLDRPAVVPKIAQASVGMLANFGAQDAVILDLVFGKYAPQGKLPVELPSSMDAVENQKEDLPYDSENPVFPFGHGLTYGE